MKETSPGFVAVVGTFWGQKVKGQGHSGRWPENLVNTTSQKANKWNCCTQFSVADGSWMCWFHFGVKRSKVKVTLDWDITGDCS